MLPALEKAEALCSADMRFERAAASTAAVRTQRRMFLLGVPKPLMIRAKKLTYIIILTPILSWASPHNCVCGLRPIFCPIRAVIKGGNTYSIPALL